VDLNEHIRLLVPVALIGWFATAGGAKAFGLLIGGSGAAAAAGAGGVAATATGGASGGAAGGGVPVAQRAGPVPDQLPLRDEGAAYEVRPVTVPGALSLP
jgi:hypothetical protein